jgi:16S rRNA U1498 N3-methylase RsmE
MEVAEMSRMMALPSVALTQGAQYLVSSSSLGSNSMKLIVGTENGFFPNSYLQKQGIRPVGFGERMSW